MIGNRNSEKKYLEDSYERKVSNMVVVYGRTGNQMTEVVLDYCRNKHFLYYRAAQASEKEQSLLFGKEMKKHCTQTGELTSYAEAFAALQTKYVDRFVLIIDEFQNIVKKDPEFLKELHKFLQERNETNAVQVLLCSSQVSWIENGMTEYFAGMTKVFGGLLKVKEYKFLDVVRAFPDSTVRQCIQIYGIIGGVPEYMECWNRSLSVKQNICELMLSPKGYLYKEAENYMRSELREPALYETILATIASGKEKLNDLHKHTEFSRAKISVYMKNLMAFGVIEKVYSFETGGWENAQKGIYRIHDTFLNFWFRFIYPNLSDLIILSPEKFFDRHIAFELDDYMNRYFRKVCMEYLELLGKVGELPLEISKMGTWIGKEGKIDLIVQNSVRENIVGLCSWSRGEMPYEVLAQLEESMGQARLKAKYRYLFSAGTFDVRLMEAAKRDESIVLVDMNSL